MSNPLELRPVRDLIPLFQHPVLYDVVVRRVVRKHDPTRAVVVERGLLLVLASRVFQLRPSESLFPVT